jgi:hypothetical protein
MKNRYNEKKEPKIRKSTKRRRRSLRKKRNNSNHLLVHQTEREGGLVQTEEVATQTRRQSSVRRRGKRVGRRPPRKSSMSMGSRRLRCLSSLFARGGEAGMRGCLSKIMRNSHRRAERGGRAETKRELKNKMCLTFDD